MGCLLYWTCIDTHGYVDGDIYIAHLFLIGRSGVENIMQRNEEYGDVRELNHGHTDSWDPGVADSLPLAVCYDCLCLISLFRTVMSCPMIGMNHLAGLDTMRDMTVPLLGH